MEPCNVSFVDHRSPSPGSLLFAPLGGASLLLGLSFLSAALVLLALLLLLELDLALSFHHALVAATNEENQVANLQNKNRARTWNGVRTERADVISDRNAPVR